MKALSLTPPWGTLIILQEKEWETRSFRTNFRGRIAVHASKVFPGWAKQLCETMPFLTALGWPMPPSPLTQTWCHDIKHRMGLLPRACIIGSVEIVDCVRVEDIRGSLSDQELAFGNYEDGRFAWKLAKPKSIHPFPAKGALGLWEAGAEATELLNAANEASHA